MVALSTYQSRSVRSLAACINIVSNVVFRRVAACRHKRADLSLPFSSLPVHTSLLKRKSYNKVFLIITPSSRMRPVSGAGCVCFDVFLTFACNGPQQNMAGEQPSPPASQHPGHLRAQATLHSKAKPIGRFISYLMPPFLRPSYRQTSSLGASRPSRGRF